jgi:YD repeat-containing protein
MGRGFSGSAFARGFFGPIVAAALILGFGSAAHGQDAVKGALVKQAPPAPPLGAGVPLISSGPQKMPDVSSEAVPDKPASPPASKAAPDPAPATKNDAVKPGQRDAAAAPSAATAAASTLAAGDPDTGGSSSNGILSPSVPTFGADGALRYSYSIDVPDFRGLEPDISLNYDSGRKTKLTAGYQGWLGFGWGLDGFDVIERQRPRGGVPAFDGNDVYLLNGTELVPCVAGTDSPSCATGGNYATEVESYQRIKNDTASNTWTVTQRDGTRLEFYPMASFATAALADSTVAYSSRWLLKHVIDTHGNTVYYNYDCTDGTVCYPKTVDFGPYQIAFNMETRPDHILMANGRTIARTAKRIKSVKVTTGGAMISAWALFYGQAPASNNSRLNSIYRFGSNAILDASGAVTEGAWLPPVTFQYRDFGAGSFTAWDKTISSECTDTTKAAREELTFGDIDNNGKDELVFDKNSKCNGIIGTKLFVNRFDFVNVSSSISQNSSSSTILHQSSLNNKSYTDESPYSVNHIFQNIIGNFTGAENFKSIVTQYYAVSAGNTISYNAKNYVTNFDSSLAPTITACSSAGPYGEDCTNLFQSAFGLGGKSSPSVINRFPIDIAGETKISQLGSTLQSFTGIGDFAGNGVLRPAVVFGKDISTVAVFDTPSSPVFGGLYVNVPYVSLAHKDGQRNYTRLADVNGDGLTDVLYVWGSLNVRVYLATGADSLSTATNKYVYVGPTATVGEFYAQMTGEFSFADVDGDGRANIIGQWTNVDGTEQTAPNVAYDFRFGGAADSVAMVNDFMLTFNPSLPTGDINGDGLPDFPVKITGSNYFKFQLSNGAEGLPNSLLSVKNELGGVHSFKFKPSTRYVNTFLPFAMSTLSEIKADDGRGQTATQYISYYGGKYDPALRRFMGFRSVNETRPCGSNEAACASTETIYRQDVASTGQPERIITRDAAGVTRRDVAETYLVRKSDKPYFAKNTATETTLTEGGVSAMLKSERVFDAYGNVTDTKDYGRTDANGAGDELRVISAYLYNTAAYIVDKPYATIASNSLADGAPVIKQSTFFYDSAAVATTLPTKGDLTRQDDYQSLAPAYNYVSSVYVYDQFGNRTSATNRLNETTSWTYDTQSYLFVTQETNALGQKALSTPNRVCGAPANKTAVDGVWFTYLYDEFCRLQSEKNEVTLGWTYLSYSGFGVPELQYVLRTTPHAGDNANSAYTTSKPISTVLAGPIRRGRKVRPRRSSLSTASS